MAERSPDIAAPEFPRIEAAAPTRPPRCASAPSRPPCAHGANSLAGERGAGATLGPPVTGPTGTPETYGLVKSRAFPSRPATVPSGPRPNSRSLSAPRPPAARAAWSNLNAATTASTLAGTPPSRSFNCPIPLSKETTIFTTSPPESARNFRASPTPASNRAIPSSWAATFSLSMA